jgi:hypothetical protein
MKMLKDAFCGMVNTPMKKGIIVPLDYLFLESLWNNDFVFVVDDWVM